MKVPGARQVFELSDNDVDEHFKEAVELVMKYDKASASLLQRRLQIGYARPARLIDQLEAAGVVVPAIGAEPREILIRSLKELFGEEWEKLPKNVEVNAVPNPSKDPFDNIYFWFKVLKISLIVLVPYWVFGFEVGVLVGIIVLALFLSKISLTLLEMNEYPEQQSKASSTSKSEAEGKLIV